MRCFLVKCIGIAPYQPHGYYSIAVTEISAISISLMHLNRFNATTAERSQHRIAHAKRTLQDKLTRLFCARGSLEYNVLHADRSDTKRKSN